MSGTIADTVGTAVIVHLRTFRCKISDPWDVPRSSSIEDNRPIYPVEVPQCEYLRRILFLRGKEKPKECVVALEAFPNLRNAPHCWAFLSFGSPRFTTSNGFCTFIRCLKGGRGERASQLFFPWDRMIRPASSTPHLTLFLSPRSRRNSLCSPSQLVNFRMIPPTARGVL